MRASIKMRHPLGIEFMPMFLQDLHLKLGMQHAQNLLFRVGRFNVESDAVAKRNHAGVHGTNVCECTLQIQLSFFVAACA